MKKTKKLIRTSLLMIALGITVSIPLTVSASANIPKSIIDQRTYEFEWRYKIVNGKLYKRLYNVTKGEWVGDWILVT